MTRNDGRINVMYCAGFCTFRRRRQDDVCGLAGVVLLPLNSINNRKNNQLTVRSLIEGNGRRFVWGGSSGSFRACTVRQILISKQDICMALYKVSVIFRPYGRKSSNCTTCENPTLADVAVLSIHQRQ